MRIKSIDIIPINLRPVKVGYREEDSLSRWAHVDTIIIRVNTDTGITGLGEAATIRSYFKEIEEGVVAWLRDYEQVLIGENPLDVVNAHSRMDIVSGENSPGCHPARAAIDMALYDIIGRTEFELLTNLYEENPEEKAKACQEYVQKGFRGLKVKVGDILLQEGWSKQNIEKEKAKLIAALEVVPKDIYIDADANQTWHNPKIALNVIEDQYCHLRQCCR